MGKKWKEMGEYEKSQRYSEIGKSLGVRKSNYTDIPGGVGGKAYNAYHRKESYEKRVKDAIGNDYDTRRAIEAAALGGDGKAKKLAKGDFSKGRNMNKAYEFMGKPTDAADYGSKYFREVEKERKSFENDIDERTNEKVDALKSDFMEKIKGLEAAATEPIEVESEPSERLAKATDEVEAIEKNMFVPSTLGTEQADAPDADEQAGSVAQNMLNNYKKNIADRLTPSTARSVDGL